MELLPEYIAFMMIILKTEKKYMVVYYMPVTVPVTRETAENRRKPWLLQSLHAARVVEGWDWGTSKQINKVIWCSKGSTISIKGGRWGGQIPKKGDT